MYSVLYYISYLINKLPINYSDYILIYSNTQTLNILNNNTCARKGNIGIVDLLHFRHAIFVNETGKYNNKVY